MVGVRARASVLVLAIAAALGLSCHGDDGDASSSGDEEVEPQLMHTDEGVPIVALIPDGNWAYVIMRDDSVHDVMTEWASCVDRFRQCVRKTAPDKPIVACVNAIPTCANGEMASGDDCCPKKCIADFVSRVDPKDPLSEDRAMEDTVMRGVDCVAGFRDLWDGGVPTSQKGSR